MLFEARLWPGLRDGSITLAFRRWRRPHARAGSRHRTPAGVLVIDAVDPIDPGRIDDRAARRAGHPDRAALLRALDVYGAGIVYRVAFHYAGADPRVALRGAARPSEEEWTRVTTRLARLDAGHGGAWTLRTL